MADHEGPHEAPDRVEPTSGGRAAVLQWSTSTQITAIIGVVALLSAGMLWMSNQRASTGADAPVGPASASDPRTSADADAKAPTATGSEFKAPKPKKPEKPVAILDTIELGGRWAGCDEDIQRDLGVNVIERRGEVDQVEVIWKSKELKWERSLRMYPDGEKMWSSILTHMPVDVDLQLLVVITGPGGETTLGKSIARYC